MIASKEYKSLQPPKFRFDALEEEFCKFWTGVCEIFKEYGSLEDHFDIRQMLSILKIENWEKIPPFAFYMTPLKDSITKVRKTMLKMREMGHLRMKYIIEDNEELQDQTKEVIKNDLVAQWLVGDELKQDQFKFFYFTVKIIFESALKDKLLQGEDTILNDVIP